MSSTYSPYASRVTLFLLAALLFVWSIPHGIAIRYLLMVGLLAAVAISLGKDQTSRALSWPFGPELALYGLITIWLIIHMLLFSRNLKWSWGEFSGQWLISTALLGLGLGLGGLALSGRRVSSASILLATIVLVFASQAAFTVGDALWYWSREGSLPFQQARLTGSKTGMSYLVNVMLAFLSADLLNRLSTKPSHARMLPWLTPVSLMLIVLGLYCTYLIGARNGTFGILFLAGTTTLLYAFEQRVKLTAMRFTALLLGILVLVLGFAYSSYKADPRWQTFEETAAIAWDIDRHPEWRTPMQRPFNLPRLSNGNPVDESAFLRIAWVHGGLRLIEEYPLGVGYGRNAFGHAISLKYGYPYSGHSHSSMIDWTLEVGIPGLLLWLAFIWVLMRRGLRSWFRDKNPSGLLLLFVVTGFFGRSIVDSNMRDHMMEMFMMLSGILLVLTTMQWQINTRAPDLP